jgi:DNA adenine methylase
VYFDPPYDTLTESANFTSYDKSWFGRDMQEKLRDVFVKLDKKIIILLQKVNDLFKFRFSYWL